MARVGIDTDEATITVRLTLLEKLMALRRSVAIPLAAVVSADVVDAPLSLRSGVLDGVTMGFAAGGAPGQRLATVGPRAKYRDGRALIIVWRNQRSVRVHLTGPSTPWRLLVVSQPDADAIAAAIERAAR